MLKKGLIFLLSTAFVTSVSKTVTKRPKTTEKRKSFVCDTLQIDKLFTRKRLMDQKLTKSLEVLRSSKNDRSSRVVKHRLMVLKVIQREMNDSQRLFHQSLANLRTLLQGNYASMLELKQTSKARLEQLQNAMVQAEDEYNLVIEEEAKEREEQSGRKHAHHKGGGKPTAIRDYINNLFVDISHAADDLQKKMKDDTFEHEIRSKDHKMAINTVITVGGQEAESGSDNEGVVMLIDSDSNHFVLSKSRDSTVTHVDHVLLRDVMVVVMMTFVLMMLCNALQLPSIFGAVLAGVVLGPAGTGYVKSIVQIETIGEFGVFFFLFTVGLELSPEKLRKVLRQALIGTIGIFVCSVFIGLCVGRVFGILLRQSVFVAMCLAFCSTPVVTSIVEGYAVKDHREGSGEDYMSLLKSMLLLQDLVLGMFMAAIPILSGHVTDSHSFAYIPGNVNIHSLFHGAFGGPAEEIFFSIFEFVFALCGISFMTFVISKYAAAKYFRGLNLFGPHHQSFVLGIITAIFAIVSGTEMIGISMELGGFICGTITGSMGEPTIKQVSQIIVPFKDFFTVLFFASIGFHVFPSFVLSEIAVFIPITGLVILIKFSVVVFILHQVLPRGNKSKWLVAIGLSQMSELSFVLGSRARRNGLIGREVYLVILSVTTLSLLVSPFMWRTVYFFVMQSGPWNIQNIVRRLKASSIQTPT